MQDLFDSTVVLAPPTANLLISFMLPLLVAASAKVVAPAWVKAFINLFLATALGVITLLSQAGVEGVPMKRLLVYVVVAMIASDLAYNYVWKPLGIWPLIAEWTSGFGFGGKATEQPLNPRGVLTPPPGGVGAGPDVNTRDITFTMETGMGFVNHGNLERQVLVEPDLVDIPSSEMGLAPCHVEGAETEYTPIVPFSSGNGMIGSPHPMPKTKAVFRIPVIGPRVRRVARGNEQPLGA